MSDDCYRCVCHTCGMDRLVEGLEDAQAVFNDHAERTHEVELLNHRTRRYDPRPSYSNWAETTDGDDG
ncbi:hypothetical protein [Natronolimnohabitans innermongolicus]|nr:hypothetical protein [Natronolimnohabitans innermongolicus]